MISWFAYNHSIFYEFFDSQIYSWIQNINIFSTLCSIIQFSCITWWYASKFCSGWAFTKCALSEQAWVNRLPQIWQPKGFSPVWTTICLLSLEGWVKPLKHSGQTTLFSVPVCIALNLKNKTKINLQNRELAHSDFSFWLFLGIFGNTRDTPRVFLQCVLNSVASNYSFAWILDCKIHTQKAFLRCEFACDGRDRKGHRRLWSKVGRCVSSVILLILKDHLVPLPRKPWKFEKFH